MNVRSSIHDIISIAAGKKKYHPIKDMLRSFEYKGDGYIRKLLPEYLGVEDNEYNYEVMKLAMVAGVKRIYEPGCKYDYCVVFQGRQGIGKSTFISKLALNPEWYSDSISVLGKGREAAEQLRRKWIVEIGELSAFKKSENESIKSFLSSQQDSFREAANEDDAWTDIIFEYLLDKVKHETKRAANPKDIVDCKVNATEIFDNVLHGQRANFQKKTAQRINDVIRLLPEWKEEGSVTINKVKGRGFTFRMSKSDAEDYLKRLGEM